MTYWVVHPADAWVLGKNRRQALYLFFKFWRLSVPRHGLFRPLWQILKGQL